MLQRQELEIRWESCRQQLRAAKLDGLLVSSPVNLTYFAGFRTPFTISLTRPYFFVIPAEGEPQGVVPELAARLFSELSGLDNVTTWKSPRPDDEGVRELMAVLEKLPRRWGRLGAELGPRTRLGLPLADFDRLRAGLGAIKFVDASAMIERLRSIKSGYEADQLRRVCSLASEAYERVPAMMRQGRSLKEVCREFAGDALDLGVDEAPFVAAEKGSGGYRTAIAAPSDEPIRRGDVVVIDCGFRCEGYFCDFNRNWAIGDGDDATRRAYAAAYQVTEVGIARANIGVPLGSVWGAMVSELLKHGDVAPGSRLGHGLGLELTEEPSIVEMSEAIIQPGMVLTIEPGLVYGGGKVMLHEENILITENGPELLTQRAKAELPVIA